MMSSNHLVQTIKEKCRVCYTCVRECPAKAIRIVGGQAEILPDRCIACGNCVIVCSQNAKEVRSSEQLVENLIERNEEVVAIVAPSFVTEFSECSEQQFVGALKNLGFSKVMDVSFGADLVANQYKSLLDANPDKRFITSPCPAVVSYVEKYHPALVKYLVSIVSPMVALARVIHQDYGRKTKVVFIGPCVAKKHEAERPELEREIDAVLTFSELRKWFKHVDIVLSNIQEVEFDGYESYRGAIFPMCRGILQAAAISDDLVYSNIISVEGNKHCIQSLREYENGNLEGIKLLDPLCCEGCIMGPGMTTDKTIHERQVLISKRARKRMSTVNKKKWEESLGRFEYLDLKTRFTINDKRLPMPSKDEVKKILNSMGKYEFTDELNCGACGYESCLNHAVAIHRGLAESEMCLPYTIEKLKMTAKELSTSYEMLADTKEALVQNEKLASMGQLAAGIAHEVNNPLGVVLLYAHILLDGCDKNSQMAKDLGMIAGQADRCKKIVGGLLNFARKNKVTLEKNDVVKLVETNIQSMIIPGNIKIVKSFKNEIINAEIDTTQLTQVIINLLTNAIEIMPGGGTITVDVDQDQESCYIKVADNGPGIAKENLKKIFEPFYTTKQMGKGTGLGLAVSFGIVKMHKGMVSVNSNNDSSKGDTGTEFIISIPKHSDEKHILIESKSNLRRCNEKENNSYGG
ncbi:MAG: 4Fe-4S binding protein [Bacteriovoracaceae bacterium]|nr:4Fe-4S binding protein [Bacteriovoracaceae bacterium]